MNNPIFPWKRYWFPEESDHYQDFVRGGFLQLPPEEYKPFYPAVPKQLADLTEMPVLVLMGEPGYGKSQTLNDEKNRLTDHQPNDLVIFFDLKTAVPGDEKQLLDEDKFRLVEQGRRLWILLDGLDECTLPSPANWLIDRFINKIKNPERVFVRITCRPSHWPEQLQTAFQDRWRSITKTAVETWRLCPLLKDDVCTAAQLRNIDAESLLKTIAERHIEQLAALPVTLQFVLSLYQQGKLPSQRTEIFEKGLKLLCVDSPERQNSTIKSQISADMRFQTAARIALGYILQGSNGIWNGPSVVCPSGLFDAKQVTCREQKFELTELAVSETLEQTGIFARLDGQRFQFASRTFGEFLMAWFIANSNVSITQKLKVMLHPDSQRLLPDLHEAAAWLAALDSGFLDWLVKHEPEAALEADFATLAQGDLPVLVDGLLQLAVEEQRASYGWQRLAKLKYPGLEEKLRSFITNKHNPLVARVLAIKIVNACELQELGTVLAELALNQQEDMKLRKLAASYMDNMDDDAKRLLIPLAESVQESPLKAIALSTLGLHLMDAEAFFKQISPDFLENVSGELRFQIYQDSLLNELDADGLIVGLQWIAKYAPIRHDQFASNKLKSKLLTKAFGYLNEQSVAEALVGAIKVLRSYYDHLFDDLENSERQDFFGDVFNRRIVLTELIKQIDASDVWKFFSINCFREEDCMWLFEQFDNTSLESERHVIASSIHLLIRRYENRNAVEEVLIRAGLEATKPDPILAEHLAWLVKPTDLTSQQTIDYRKQYFENKELELRFNERSEAQSNLPNPPDFYIQTNLTACEAGNLSGWGDLIASLALQEDGSQVFSHDPDSLPGWQKADDSLRSRIAEAALRYLQQATPPIDEILLKNSRTLAQAACGLAVAILADTNRLSLLPPKHLSRWCLVVVTHFFEPETQRQLFRQVRALVPEAFDTAVLKVIDQEGETASVYLLQSCREIWHPDFLQKLAETRLNAENWKFDSRLKLAELLIQNNADNVIGQLIYWLENEPDTTNRCSTAIALFRYAPEQAWDNIKLFLTEDAEFARQVILSVAYSGGYTDEIYSHLDVGQLGWLYDRLKFLFPPLEDPPVNDGVYTVTPRHDAGRFRDSMIGWLKGLGNTESIKELDRICLAYPDELWLTRARADACKNLWQKQRTQLSFTDSITLLSDDHTSVVRNSRELMDAVEAALQRFAHEAQHGSPPLAVFLWNEKQSKPFSEQRLSDFLKFYLEREWRGRRIIINREVEIRNLRDFGIGERTDLLIQTVAPNGNTNLPNPCVVIEVKPDNKAKPSKDIAEQLVAQYLDGVSRTCGIYLIGWFGQSQRRHIAGLRQDAENQAQQNSNDAITVRSVVLDISHPLRPVCLDTEPVRLTNLESVT
ncbi:hypothetical protein V2P20_07300 [Methylobacter sp. Wu1]|uniref:NACHT domain-containing protein n=1 Tax=Methylobacter sp. Wu1 TaxID=3119359 RepID=UPI002F95FEF5